MSEYFVLRAIRREVKQYEHSYQDVVGYSGNLAGAILGLKRAMEIIRADAERRAGFWRRWTHPARAFDKAELLHALITAYNCICRSDRKKAHKRLKEVYEKYKDALTPRS